MRDVCCCHLRCARESRVSDCVRVYACAGVRVYVWMWIRVWVRVGVKERERERAVHVNRPDDHACECVFFYTAHRIAEFAILSA